MNANQIPPMKSFHATAMKTPKPTSAQPTKRPSVPAKRVARLRSPGDLPCDRARDAAAVEREAGDQVEDQHDDVDRGQVAEHGERRAGGGVFEARAVEHLLRARDERAEAHAHGRDHERHDWPRHRDAELDAGRVRVAPELRHAAEQPQVDSLDRDAVADRDDRVAELVQQDRQEEEQRADRREYERARSGRHVLVVARQREDDQEEREEPADVDSDTDAEHAAQLD